MFEPWNELGPQSAYDRENDRGDEGNEEAVLYGAGAGLGGTRDPECFPQT